jgi:hypothetical protein
MRGIVGMLLFALLLSAAVNVGASTITAASCSASAVQAALSQASAGDTVFIPAGTCSWTTAVSWTAPANVTLKGAGTSATGGGDRTVIIDNYTTNSPLLNLTVSATGTFRMTGITVQGGSGVLKDNAIIKINGPGTVRLDHLHINEQTYSPPVIGKILLIGRGVTGVLDHSILNLYDIGWIHVVNGTSFAGDSDWAAATGFGSDNFFFIEDNQIDSVANPSFGVYRGTLTDCHTGGRYVARFNTLVATSVGQTHPTGHGSDDRGCRAHEIYGNLVTSPLTYEPNFAFEYNNSGTALIWGNQANNVFKNIIYFNDVRQSSSTYTQSAPPAGWGYCGTTYGPSKWDKNDDSTGEPCIDQPGRGQGDLITGLFPNKVNSTTGTVAWPHQALEPVYIWNNTASIVSGWGGNYTANISGGRVASDRDYYSAASGIQTSPTSPFNGTSGTGWGTLANRPTPCTTGVGYFATDQGSWNRSTSNPYGVQQNGADGVLYKCTATNTWTLYYTPYTYPHPLQSETVPSAPTNLRVSGL